MNTQSKRYSINSTESSFQISGIEGETAKVINYAKDILKSRIFLGRYVERRLADQRIGYRDVVLVSPAEVELKRDLSDVQSKLRLAFPEILWIGITDGRIFGNPTATCLWTEIDNEPFGPFWFQIRSIKLRQEEIIITLKCIRYISDSFLELEPILTGSSKSMKVVKAITDKSESEQKVSKTTTPVNDSFTEIIDTLKGAVSIRNVKEFLTFIFALIIALFTGSTAFINFLGNFVLALLRELSFFVKSSTPLFLGFLDFFSKIVGGFYILLAMFFKPSVPAPPISRRAIPYQYYDTSKQKGDRRFDDNSFD